MGRRVLLRDPCPVGPRRDGNEKGQGRRHRLLASGERNGDLLRPHADELGRRSRPGKRRLYPRPDHRRCDPPETGPRRPDDPYRKDLNRKVSSGRSLCSLSPPGRQQGRRMTRHADIAACGGRGTNRLQKGLILTNLRLDEAWHFGPPEEDRHGTPLSQIGIYLSYRAPEPLPSRGAAIGSAREDPPDPLLGEGGKARFPSADQTLHRREGRRHLEDAERRRHGRSWTAWPIRRFFSTRKRTESRPMSSRLQWPAFSSSPSCASGATSIRRP